MDTMSLQTWIVLGVFTLLVVIGMAAWLLRRKRQSDRLLARFGTEYEHTVDALGSRSKADSELKERQTRVERFRIVALAPSEAAWFTQAWGSLQGRFVDNPKGVVAEADELVRKLMIARGYPVADFERRAADISVDHPAVVEHYRAAQAIAVRDRRGEADTEQQRQAVVHLRALFDELLEVQAVARAPLEPARPLAVPS
jgi:hypothetical protein